MTGITTFLRKLHNIVILLTDNSDTLRLLVIVSDWHYSNSEIMIILTKQLCGLPFSGTIKCLYINQIFVGTF